MIRIFCLFSLSLFVLIAQAQLPGVSIKRATGLIKLDAVLDEEDWKLADVARDFRQYFPYDTSLSKVKTEVRLTYNDQFIYVAAIIKSVEDRSYVTPSLRRDFRGEANDGFTVVFDTFKDKTNAFLFGVNPFGVQREGLVSNGGGTGEDDFSLNWDNKWYSRARIEDDHWIVEMAIPFKTVRFKEDLSSWFVNFYLIDSHFPERSTWSPIPRNFDIVSLAFNRELLWDQPLQKPGSNVSIIPYVSVNYDKNFEQGTASQESIQAGGDAKVAIGPALNLDLTVNPDFSQVEVDEQVTNLDRFEIFFPERRQFFLENADLFANFGVEGTRPFFSRRIGIAVDTSTGQNIQNTIYGGVRLSGKINNNTRVGFLNMQAGEDKSIGLPSTNYLVGVLQQKVLTRSNLAFIVVNKQAFQDSIGGDFSLNPGVYNSTVGADFNLATSNNRWTGKAFYHHSFDQNKLDSAFAFGGNINYSTPIWDVRFFLRNVGANFNPEVGFVRRANIQQFAHTTWYNYYPSSGMIQSHGPGFDFDIVRNQLYGFLDWDVNLMYRIRLRNNANFNIRFRREYTYLFEPFDPSGTEGLELPAGSDYSPYLIIANFSSDARKRFFLNLNTRSGQYFNGSRINLGGSMTYRYQPLGFVSLNFNYNRIRLPEPYSDADLFLIGPRIDLTVSRNLFWTTFIQFNSQIDNLNINSRLQWRFKPVSDLFLVYTDNYFATTDGTDELLRIGQPKIRTIVLKLTYWLNL